MEWQTPVPDMQHERQIDLSSFELYNNNYEKRRLNIRFLFTLEYYQTICDIFTSFSDFLSIEI